MSAAPDEGAEVIIYTWLFVISGTASMGKFLKDNVPQTPSAKVNIPTINLLTIDQCIILFKMENELI